jgi:outer membrane receptor protein involved in Fe transport
VFGSSVNINVNNPFLTAAQRTYFCANALFTVGGVTQRGITPAECAAAAAPALTPSDAAYRQFTVGLRRRTPEVGPRISDYVSKTWDFRTGLRGDITDKIGFDLWAARGISNKVQNIENYVLTSRARQALLANSTGCFDPSNSCTPLNVFGIPGTITPDMVNFISQGSTSTNQVKLSQARGTISGDTPLQLWAKNPVSFAVGAEYRKYQANQKSDLLAKTPGELGGAGGAAPDINGGFDVYEGFAEVVAPIVSDRPFVDELQVEAGIRRSHYTINATPSDLAAAGLSGTPKFNTTTWKVAGSWAPVRDLKFRGNYQRAVRAPNISELFTPLTTGLTNLAVDPCAGPAPLTNATLAAVCIAQGAPASSLGGISNPTAAQANATFGGNLALKPEVADTWTVGAVLRPRFIPGLSATIDYYKIKIKKAITTPTPQDLINACFGSLSASSPTNPACTVIGRNPLTGALEGDPATTPGLLAPLTNLGKLATDGVDLTFDYRRGLGSLMGAPAKLALAFGGNYTFHQKFQATPTSINRECIGFYSVNCNPAPKIGFNERTTLSLGRVDLSLLWRYIGKVKFEPAQFQADLDAALADPATCPDPLGADPGGCIADPQFRKIGAKNYFDFATRFNVNEHFDLTFTVMNLFNKKPPIVGNTIGTTTFNSGDTFPSTYDPLGRRFAAGARIKF